MERKSERLEERKEKETEKEKKTNLQLSYFIADLFFIKKICKVFLFFFFNRKCFLIN